MEAVVRLAPAVNLGTLARQEWLVTNGRGDYAMGTVAGVPTRSYHGLLVAATLPPVRRRVLVTRLDDWILINGTRYALSWRDGRPADAFPLEEFSLDGTTPVWRFRVGTASIEKRIVMARNRPITYVTYRLIDGESATVEGSLYVDFRDHHRVTVDRTQLFDREDVEHGVVITSPDGDISTRLIAYPGTVEVAGEWEEGDRLMVETYRGLPDRSAVFRAGRMHGELIPGTSCTMVLSMDDNPPAAGFEVEAESHRQTLLGSFPRSAPRWVRQLVLAADQFIVDRTVPGARPGKTILAGYPWFTDWGRDTMIALPGLTIATGRPEIAKSILRTYARFVDQGMLPNHFPDAGQRVEYNTVDAALWFFEAVRQVWEATDDHDLMAELAPVLEEIINWYRKGTRYGIKVDAQDGLLAAGEPEVQLTWMDAMVDDWVVTPRIGKAVEINALWYQALCTMGRLMESIGRDATTYVEAARQIETSFDRFWNPETECLFDVIDGPDGNDSAIRPNQIFAVSLPDSPLPLERQVSVVEACTRDLLTPVGLRSLSPSHPDYRGTYGGDRRERDAAYHQGTVWGWLLGPYALAVYRTTGDADLARSFLLPMQAHLGEHGLGSIAEIFDGDPPHTPRGCPWQAWSVAEILRAWTVLAS